MAIILCPSSTIPDPGSKAFQLDNNGKNLDIFIVQKDGQFHGFINRCPHTGVTLEWLEDQFLDSDQVFIQCATHGALFEIDSGRCVAGPCVGDHLTPIKVNVLDSMIYAELA